MRYYICEGTPDGKYNAASKARNDVEYILKEKKIIPFFVNTKYGVQTKKILKWKQLIDYCKNYKIWKKEIKKLKKDDMIFIQYPLLNTIIRFEDIIYMLNKRGIVTVMIVHDIDSLRNKKIKRHEIEDKEVLKNASYIIAHNRKMKDYLISLGNCGEKIIELGVFDYIADNIKKSHHKKDEPIIIAGNLSKEKAGFLKDLKNVRNVKFNLYGKGYIQEEGENNISYKGAFLPEELLNNLEGSFGLVWDGVSKNSCVGAFGEYLKYNNPHKLSMYLTAGIPVIVWTESAVADFVAKNNVGIEVSNLDEIYTKIQKLTEDEYNNMIDNAKKISKKLRKGSYLINALDQIQQENKK